MIIQTYFTHSLIFDEIALQKRVAIIIDVLRASTTICYALRNGARAVIPVAEASDAAKMAKRLSKDTTLLCGERQGVKLSGFDLGNSPQEYLPDIIQKKTIIFTTTNGTQALSKTTHAQFQIIAGFVNIQSVVEFLQQHFHSEFVGNQLVEIVCAGNNRGFSYEDTLCAGAIAVRLCEAFQDTTISDSTHAAITLYEINKSNLTEFVKISEHGQILTALGFEKDIEIAMDVDSCSIVPIMRGGSLKDAYFDY